jgi:hypothetical protein
MLAEGRESHLIRKHPVPQSASIAPFGRITSEPSTGFNPSAVFEAVDRGARSSRLQTLLRLCLLYEVPQPI